MPLENGPQQIVFFADGRLLGKALRACRPLLLRHHLVPARWARATILKSAVLTLSFKLAAII